MVACRKCSRVLPTDGFFATCGGCSGGYHLNSECSVSENTWSAKSGKKKLAWRCVYCRGSRDERRPDDEMVDRLSECTEGEYEVGDRRLIGDIEDLKAVIASLKDGIRKWQEESEGRERDHGKTVKRLEEKINKLITKSEEKDRYIENLEERVSDLEKHIFAKNIEILGIPENDLRNPEESEIKKAVVTALTKNQININPADIEEAYKVENTHKQNGRPIVVVKLKARAKRMEILKQYKERTRGVERKELRVFEHISKSKKMLLWEARERAKIEQWAYVWVQDGNVLARKSDGQKVTKIQSFRDLRRISNN